jgi:hypothetical protein
MGVEHGGGVWTVRFRSLVFAGERRHLDKLAQRHGPLRFPGISARALSNSPDSRFVGNGHLPLLRSSY